MAFEVEKFCGELKNKCLAFSHRSQRAFQQPDDLIALVP